MDAEKVDWKQRPAELEDYPLYGGNHYPQLPRGLYLGLFNGAAGDDWPQEKDDWGFNGPVIGPLVYVQNTYCFHLKYNFRELAIWERYEELLNEKGGDGKTWMLNGEGWIHIDPESDCVRLGGCLWGDWTVFCIDGQGHIER